MQVATTQLEQYHCTSDIAVEKKLQRNILLQEEDVAMAIMTFSKASDFMLRNRFDDFKIWVRSYDYLST